LDILSFDLEGLKAPGSGFVETVKLYLSGLRDALTEEGGILDVMADLESRWGPAIVAAANTIAPIQTFWESVAGITSAIDQAAELGGPDIGAARAMAGMTEMVGRLGPGGYDTTAGGIPIGQMAQGPVQHEWNITLDWPAMGMMGSGRATEEWQDGQVIAVNMRILAGAKSVG